MRKRRRRTKRSKIKDQIKAIQCLRSPTKRTTRAKEEEDRKKRTGRLHGTARHVVQLGGVSGINETKREIVDIGGSASSFSSSSKRKPLAHSKLFRAAAVASASAASDGKEETKWNYGRRRNEKRRRRLTWDEAVIIASSHTEKERRRRRKKSLTDRLVQCPKSLLLTAFNNRRGSGIGSRKGINWPLGPFHQQHQMTIELTNKDLMMPRHRHDMILLSAFFPSFLLFCLSSTALTPSSISATVCLLFFSSSVHLRFTIFRCQTNKQRNCLRFQFVYARNPLRWFDPCKNRPTISSYWSRPQQQSVSNQMAVGHHQ